jgi:flavin-dependent dehydrogenase
VASPAETRVAARFAGADWMAVGDAAASFDPLSSQGIATAVMMGARAGAALARRDRAEAIADWSDGYAMIVAEHASLRPITRGRRLAGIGVLAAAAGHGAS